MRYRWQKQDSKGMYYIKGASSSNGNCIKQQLLIE